MARKRMSKGRKTARSTKGGVAVVFKSKRGKAYVKKFKSRTTAARAVKGLKKVGSKPVGIRKAKGFKFGAMVKRMNRRK